MRRKNFSNFYTIVTKLRIHRYSKMVKLRIQTKFELYGSHRSENAFLQIKKTLKSHNFHSIVTKFDIHIDIVRPHVQSQFEVCGSDRR